jgi:hypothetical protein
VVRGNLSLPPNLKELLFSSVAVRLFGVLPSESVIIEFLKLNIFIITFKNFYPLRANASKKGINIYSKEYI